MLNCWKALLSKRDSISTPPDVDASSDPVSRFLVLFFFFSFLFFLLSVTAAAVSAVAAQQVSAFVIHRAEPRLAPLQHTSYVLTLQSQTSYHGISPVGCCRDGQAMRK